MGHEGTTPVGIYELKKQSWNYNGYHYHRLVYIFKPVGPKLKLKDFKPKQVKPKPMHWYELDANEEHYPKPSFSS